MRQWVLSFPSPLRLLAARPSVVGHGRDRSADRQSPAAQSFTLSPMDQNRRARRETARARLEAQKERRRREIAHEGIQEAFCAPAGVTCRTARVQGLTLR